MSLDSSLLSLALDHPSLFNQLRQAGITEEHFVDGYDRCWRWIINVKKQHGAVPSRGVTENKFTELTFHSARKRDLPVLLHDLQERKKFRDFCSAIEEATLSAATPDDLADSMSILQQRMNELSTRNGSSHIIDLFSTETNERIVSELHRRRSGLQQGFPTGLKRFDAVTGGLHKNRMYVVMGRSGTGKTWINLLFVANAVLSGAKVILYPLEMTLEETALRLYTIFSQTMLGADKVFKNTDLSRGAVSRSKVVKFLGQLEDKFAGQLMVADIGSMSNAYTVDRIEAEVEAYKPDIFWVDYLTLMKAPGVGRNGGEDFTTVKVLSNGIKQISMRHHVVGGVSAQVNREALKSPKFLPRIEHIAYGDSIGQDADGVVSINKKDDSLYYSLVKNRHGPEFGKTRVKFYVNSGLLEESEDQDDDDD